MGIIKYFTRHFVDEERNFTLAQSLLEMLENQAGL